MPRSQSGTNKQVSARIQRLCCIGVGGEILMPDLLREVTGLIPSRHGNFFWVGPHHEITNSYNTFPPALMKLYLQEFFMTDRENSA